MRASATSVDREWALNREGTEVTRTLIQDLRAFVPSWLFFFVTSSDFSYHFTCNPARTIRGWRIVDGCKYDEVR